MGEINWVKKNWYNLTKDYRRLDYIELNFLFYSKYLEEAVVVTDGPKLEYKEMFFEDTDSWGNDERWLANKLIEKRYSEIKDTAEKELSELRKEKKIELKNGIYIAGEDLVKVRWESSYISAFRIRYEYYIKNKELIDRKIEENKRV